jgi:hypothetical protein
MFHWYTVTPASHFPTITSITTSTKLLRQTFPPGFIKADRIHVSWDDGPVLSANVSQGGGHGLSGGPGEEGPVESALDGYRWDPIAIDSGCWRSTGRAFPLCRRVGTIVIFDDFLIRNSHQGLQQHDQHASSGGMRLGFVEI